MLKLTAKFSLLTDLREEIVHIEGKHNPDPDMVSRPQELFGYDDFSYFNRSYRSMLLQICRLRPNFVSFNVFLPTKELLSTVLSAMSSDWQPSPIIPKKLGRIYPVNSILSGSAEPTNFTTTCFL